MLQKSTASATVIVLRQPSTPLLPPRLTASILLLPLSLSLSLHGPGQSVYTERRDTYGASSTSFRRINIFFILLLFFFTAFLFSILIFMLVYPVVLLAAFSDRFHTRIFCLWREKRVRRIPYSLGSEDRDGSISSGRPKWAVWVIV